MKAHFKPHITLFHCINTFTDSASLTPTIKGALELKTVPMACSSMVKDVFMLRAFESGSDAVVVMVCPEEQCRYLEGSIRAQKRVNWVKNLLVEIEIDGRRLTIHHLASDDSEAAGQIIRQVVSSLKTLGPSPAK